jgi:hypothetical protein
VHATWFRATFGPGGAEYVFEQIATRSERLPGVGDQPAFIDSPPEAACNDTLLMVYVGNGFYPVSELPEVTNLKVTGKLSARTVAGKYLPAEGDC